jgi:hypothetical protein
MLERDCLTKIETSHSLAISTSATYRQPSLCLAARIAKLMRADFPTQRLLHYHQRAVIERDHPSASDGASWFISLYKVRDFLSKFYDGASQAKTVLGISKGQWNDFGAVLNNNDLRHAEVSGIAPQISSEQIAKLYNTNRSVR